MVGQRIVNIAFHFNIESCKLIQTRGGPIGRKKMHPRNYFCIFYLFQLKLRMMVKLCIPKKSYVFLFFDFNCFGRENDVTRLTAKFTKFQVMAKQINNFERACRDTNKCEKNFGNFSSIALGDITS